ncbi:MAG: hypothetical protein AB6733_12345 [Clostridiaceae bacterium]
MTNFHIAKTKEFILQFSYECLTYSEKAVKGYSEYKNVQISIQYLNEAFQCIKHVQSFYMQTFERGELQAFEEYFHQFMVFNDEFLSAIESEHDLQWSFIELDSLTKLFNELKSSITT